MYSENNYFSVLQIPQLIAINSNLTHLITPRLLNNYLDLLPLYSKKAREIFNYLSTECQKHTLALYIDLSGQTVLPEM